MGDGLSYKRELLLINNEIEEAKNELADKIDKTLAAKAKSGFSNAFPSTLNIGTTLISAIEMLLKLVFGFLGNRLKTKTAFKEAMREIERDKVFFLVNYNKEDNSNTLYIKSN
ncbi:MAG: hypothetical protein HC896_03930 [Bacteroidales bacterium]|nr:hypothetical protein [Bacteroidales bacterium]